MREKIKEIIETVENERAYVKDTILIQPKDAEELLSDALDQIEALIPDVEQARQEERERILRDIKAVYKDAGDLGVLETAIREFIIYEEQSLKEEC